MMMISCRRRRRRSRRLSAADLFFETRTRQVKNWRIWRSLKKQVHGMVINKFFITWSSGRRRWSRRFGEECRSARTGRSCTRCRCWCKAGAQCWYQDRTWPSAPCSRRYPSGLRSRCGICRPPVRFGKDQCRFCRGRWRVPSMSPLCASTLCPHSPTTMSRSHCLLLL